MVLLNISANRGFTMPKSSFSFNEMLIANDASWGGSKSLLFIPLNQSQFSSFSLEYYKTSYLFPISFVSVLVQSNAKQDLGIMQLL